MLELTPRCPAPPPLDIGFLSLDVARSLPSPYQPTPLADVDSSLQSHPGQPNAR